MTLRGLLLLLALAPAAAVASARGGATPSGPFRRGLTQAPDDCAQDVPFCTSCRFQAFRGTTTRAICFRCEDGYAAKALGRACCECARRRRALGRGRRAARSVARPTGGPRARRRAGGSGAGVQPLPALPGPRRSCSRDRPGGVSPCIPTPPPGRGHQSPHPPPSRPPRVLPRLLPLRQRHLRPLRRGILLPRSQEHRVLRGEPLPLRRQQGLADAQRAVRARLRCAGSRAGGCCGQEGKGREEKRGARGGRGGGGEEGGRAQLVAALCCRTHSPSATAVRAAGGGGGAREVGGSV
jgi:hypothetical protein